MQPFKNEGLQNMETSIWDYHNCKTNTGKKSLDPFLTTQVHIIFVQKIGNLLTLWKIISYLCRGLPNDMSDIDLNVYITINSES